MRCISCLSVKSAGNPIDSQNIRHDADFFVIQGFYEAADGTPEEIYCGMKRRQKKQFKRNKKEYTRLSDHIGFLPLVMVSPADSELIAGGSDERRRLWMWLSRSTTKSIWML